jgi:hypothetical protein
MSLSLFIPWRRTTKTLSPYFNSMGSSGAFPNENVQPAPAGFPIGAEIVDDMDGVSADDEMTRPGSAVMLLTKP